MVDLIRGEKRPQRRSEVEFKLREQEDKMCSQSSVNPRSAALWKGEFGRLKEKLITFKDIVSFHFVLRIFKIKSSTVVSTGFPYKHTRHVQIQCI